jgi:hypothetical protein
VRRLAPPFSNFFEHYGQDRGRSGMLYQRLVGFAVGLGGWNGRATIAHGRSSWPLVLRAQLPPYLYLV